MSYVPVPRLTAPEQSASELATTIRAVVKSIAYPGSVAGSTRRKDDALAALDALTALAERAEAYEHAAGAEADLADTFAAALKHEKEQYAAAAARAEETERKLGLRDARVSQRIAEIQFRAEAAEKERDGALDWNNERVIARAVNAEGEVARLTADLEAIAAQQPKTLAMIRANGFVFDSIGKEPGNWQHLAFSIYTDLCEVDTIARAALAKDTP